MASTSTEPRYQLIEQVAGYEGRKNDILLFPCASKASATTSVYYFGGDIQDLPERMCSSRENRPYQRWNLISTGDILSRRFADSSVIVVRPNEMKDGTFSRFSNFLPKTTEYGDPIFYDTTRLVGLHHLRALDESISKSTADLTLIGFSKGCVVLNQLLHELTALRTMTDDDGLSRFVSRIRRFIWLDGGHNNGERAMIWPTDENLVATLAHFQVQVEVYVTPFQIDAKNPYKKHHVEQYRAFSQLLASAFPNSNQTINRILLRDDKPSIEKHFELLTTF